MIGGKENEFKSGRFIGNHINSTLFLIGVGLLIGLGLVLGGPITGYLMFILLLLIVFWNIIQKKYKKNTKKIQKKYKKNTKKIQKNGKRGQYGENL